MVSSDVIEKYQTIMRHNPHSQVFAPLADAYLERGLILQAEELATKGTERHPSFPAGFLVLGKIQLKNRKLEAAEESIKKAIELSPQNILAHQVLGDVYLELKKPLEALKAFKMVLFLNPHSQRAKQAVEKLEAASALEFEEETFAMAKLSDLRQVQKNTVPSVDASAASREKARKMLLQLVDAFLIRNDGAKAFDLLQEIQNEYGAHPDIESRLKKAVQKPFTRAQQSAAPSSSAPISPLSSPSPASVNSPMPARMPTAGSNLTLRIAREKRLRKLYAMLRAVRFQQGLPSEPNP